MKSTRLLLAGEGCLAFGVAFTNAGFVLHTQTSVSHLTGDIAKLSMDLPYWSAEIQSHPIPFSALDCTGILTRKP